MSNHYFTDFKSDISKIVLPDELPDPFSKEAPHEIAQLAASELQYRLSHDTDIDHNFGVGGSSGTRPIGKMLGVLVVKDQEEKLGYLSAFSGKLSGGNHFPGFVPPVYDGLQKGGFLNKGMTELTKIIQKIKALQNEQKEENEDEISRLLLVRSNHSKELQKRLFSSYHFLNNNKVSKSLIDIFADTPYHQPPGGAGECAAPKLLQYAYQNELKPIAMSEFWWGISPKSEFRQHKKYYPACEEKCKAVLGWMLCSVKA